MKRGCLVFETAFITLSRSQFNPLKDRLGAYRRLPLYLDWITCKNGYFNPKNMILGSGRVDLGKKHVFFLKKNAKHAILAHL